MAKVSNKIDPASAASVKSASAIAKAQNTGHVFHVFGDWPAKETVSGTEWADGQVIHTFEDVATFYTDAASVGLEGLPLALSNRQVYDRVTLTLGDSQQAQDDRIDDLQTEHIRLREKPGISAVADEARIDPLIETLAPILAEALGKDINEGWTAKKTVQFIAAQIAVDLKDAITPEQLQRFPDCSPDNKRPAKTPIRSNQSYNGGYRGRIKSDWAPPSWVGDMYWTMPNTKSGIELGQSVKAKLDKLNPDHKKADALSMETKDEFEALKKQAANGIRNLQDAIRLIQRMAVINEFDRVSCEFRSHKTIADRLDVQVMNPVKLIGYKNKADKQKKAMSDFAYLPVSRVLNRQLQRLSRKDATLDGVLGANPEREKTIEPMVKMLEVYEQFSRQAKFLSGGRSEGLKAEIKAMIEAKDGNTKMHKNQSTMNDLLVIHGVIDGFKAAIIEALQEDKAQVEINAANAKDASKVQDAKVQAALSNGHKTAA